MSIPNDPVDVPAVLGFNVTVNARARTLPAATTLADLMALMAAVDSIDGSKSAPQTGAATATAVNGEFVPIGQCARRTLREGDQITCFQLIVGG